MTKLEAITHLNNAFKNNQKFKKDFSDYIELCILEEIENNKIKLSTEKQLMLVKTSSAHIMGLLFSPDWWSAQGLK